MALKLIAETAEDCKPEFNRKFGMLKSKFTTTEKFLNGENVKLTNSECNTRIVCLEKTYDDYVSIVNDFVGIVSQEDFETYTESFAEFENRYHSIISQINSLCTPPSSFENIKTDDSESLHKVAVQSAKLPEIKIPIFDGNDLTQWTTFRDTYIAVIHSNNNIDEVIKFTFLMDKLRGDAKASIGHISLTKTGYEKAWSTLIQIYDDKRIIIDKHIDALIDLETVFKRKESELRKLLNASMSHMSSLSASGFEFDQISQLFAIKLVTRKLDSRTRGEWEETIENNELPKWEDLVNFLERKCRVLRETESFATKITSHPNSHSNSKTFSKSSYSKPVPRRESSFMIKKSLPNEKCGTCGKQQHPLFSCPTFLSFTPQQRFEKIKTMNACINCLNPKHRVSDCRSSGCKLCKSLHHTLLHFDQGVTFNSNPNESQTVVENTPVEKNNFHLKNQLGFEKSTMLPTAIVSIENSNGNLIQCRVLLDSGSQSNFITEKFAKKLNLTHRHKNNLIVTGLNGNTSNCSQSVSSTVHSNYKPFHATLDFAIIEKISDSIPSKTYDISHWQVPKQIKLADPFFNVSAPIDILIGVEMFPDILLPNRIYLSPKHPSIQESIFGWIIFGKFEQKIEYNFSLIASSESIVTNEQLDQSIQKMWEIENIPPKRFMSDEEKKCEMYYMQTTQRDLNGRYTVSIPFRESPECLGDSKLNALNRFCQLERKLESNSELKNLYVEFINEYIQLGHMKLINENINDESSEPTYYMPHHAVLKPSSSSTKLRVVFDASAKTLSKKSLNQLMMIGPTVQDTLFEIILRFRLHRFAMSSDISKMYRQVNIKDSQTRLQRILWRENTSEPIKIYELTTVTYGTASAPYLATRTLNQLALDEAKNYPLASKVTAKDFYVDDLITGCDTIEEAKNLQRDIIAMLNNGGFHLHKWCASDPRLLEDIPNQDLEILKFNEFSLGDCIKALGLLWQPKEDYFIFKPPILELDKPLTKRAIVSDIAKLYDPLGFLSPIIITGKIIVQVLWESKVDWDQLIPDVLQEMWIKYVKTLNNISQIWINRNVMGHTATNKIMRTELHGYSDASEKAYGACLYIKTIDSDNNISVNLLCSKSRVAPLKSLSLPRLELSAALLLAKLASATIEALGITFDDIILWSDSTITLCWIKTSPNKLKTFVSNRVNEIQELTVNMTWKHVSSANNPADLITRGIMPDDLNFLHLWWHGPTMIQSNTYESIMTSTLKDFDDSIAEIKQERTVLIAQTESDVILNLLNKFESFEKPVRIVAYVLRFIKSLKRIPFEKSNLSVSELNDSTLKIVKHVQQKSFPNEFKALKNNQDVGQKSPLKQLYPFLDKHDVMRVGGRLCNAKSLRFNIKHQILLPPKHILTKLIFQYQHKIHIHPGPQLLLSYVRQHYWPIHGKITAKQVFKSCVTCFKAKPIPCQQIMGNLPTERFDTVKAFFNTGVDFCGPFLIKTTSIRRAAPVKMYIASFVCLCTKAVHFEIVPDLSTKSFISCLRRFTSRRGTVQTVWSDNATNFRGTKSELHELYELYHDQAKMMDIYNFCATERINWKFIPPRAPNFGGLWEASIKSFKTHFKRVVRDQVLFYDEFHTLVVQIEAVLNSRPLTIMSDDPTDPEPLTPAHFLTGGPVSLIPEQSYENIKEYRLSNWQKVSKMLESFWRRYSLEYRHNLQTRSKWTSSKINVKKGDVVLVIQDNLPPAKWPLAIVIETIPGTDGNVRVIELRMVVDGVKKNFKRPITKICKLPIEA